MAGHDETAFTWRGKQTVDDILEDLAALIEPLSGLEATVTVLSPPRIVIVLK